MQKRKNVVKELVARGADTNLRNKFGQTPEELASSPHPPYYYVVELVNFIRNPYIKYLDTAQLVWFLRNTTVELDRTAQPLLRGKESSGDGCNCCIIL